MYAKKIKYTDFNDNEREETFYFYLSKSELQKLELSQNGGMSNLIEKIIASQDQAEIIGLFEKIIDLSYGEKDLDGRGFHKSPEILEKFKSTAAYDELYMQLSHDSKAASEFVNNIMPKDIQGQMKNVDVDKLPDNVQKAIEAGVVKVG